MDTLQFECSLWRLLRYLVVFFFAIVLPYGLEMFYEGIAGGFDNIEIPDVYHSLSFVGLIPALMALPTEWSLSRVQLLRTASWPRRIGILVAPLILWMLIPTLMIGLHKKIMLIPLIAGGPWYVLAVLGRWGHGLRLRPARWLSLPLAVLLIIVFGGWAISKQHDPKNLGFLFICMMQAPSLAALLVGGLAERLENYLAVRYPC